MEDNVGVEDAKKFLSWLKSFQTSMEKFIELQEETESKVDSLKDSLEGTDSMVNATNDTVNELSEKVDEIENTISKVDMDAIITATADQEEIRSDVNAIEHTVTDLDAWKEDATNRLEVLEGQVKEMTDRYAAALSKMQEVFSALLNTND